MNTLDLPPRFRRKIRVETRQELVAGACWVWTGARDKESGYGRVAVEGRTAYSHRAIYTLLIGQIPSHLQLDHLCRVRECCNPEHLDPVTCKTNCQRGSKGTQTHCRVGHPLSGENLRILDRQTRVRAPCLPPVQQGQGRRMAARSEAPPIRHVGQVPTQQEISRMTEPIGFAIVLLTFAGIGVTAAKAFFARWMP